MKNASEVIDSIIEAIDDENNFRVDGDMVNVPRFFCGDVKSLLQPWPMTISTQTQISLNHITCTYVI